ncbi:MAG: VWA domain-containing protein [Acidobacteriota bacterium]
MNRMVGLVVVLGFLCCGDGLETQGSLLLASGAPQSAPQERPFSLRVDVDLVTINLTVLDENGNKVTDLRRDDFTVYEDDVVQDIFDFQPVDAPFHLVLVLDTSNSTRTSLSLIRKAAVNFTGELRPVDRIAVAEINFFVREVQDFTSDRRALRRSIERLTTYPYGGSKVYDGVGQALAQLHKISSGRKAIVILSDGMENSSKTKFEELRYLLAQSDSVLYPITIQNKDRQKDQLEHYIRTHSEEDPFMHNARTSLSVLEEVYQIQTERLQILAEETGGKIYLVNDLSDLSGEYSKVAQELRTTLGLAYYSKNNARDGRLRRIRVEVKNPKYQVRAKSTYFVPKE